MGNVLTSPAKDEGSCARTDDLGRVSPFAVTLSLSPVIPVRPASLLGSVASPRRGAHVGALGGDGAIDAAIASMIRTDDVVS
jgi:hypothetical protein